MTDSFGSGGIEPGSQPDYPVAPPSAEPSPGGQPSAVGQWQVAAPSSVGSPAWGDPTAAPPPIVEAAGAAGPGGSGGRRGKRTLAALAGAAVVLGAGAYASAQLLGDEAGASSPEEAGQQLLAAIEGEDLLGVIELLPDGERQVMLDITDELTDAGNRLGVLDDSFRLDGFRGLDLEIEDPELEVEEVGDGIARVSLVDGTVTAEIDGEEVVGNLGDVVDAIADGNDTEVEAEDADEELDIGEIVDEAIEDADDDGGAVLNPFMVTVVEQDGRWFPSIGFTIAEIVRLDADRFGDGPSGPDLVDGIDPDGAEDPEDVIQSLLDAAVEADPEAAVALLDPGELGAAQVYADALLGDLEQGDELEFTAEVTDAEVTSLGDGVNRVLPTGLRIEGEVDGDEVRAELDDGCVTFEVDAADPDEDVDFELCSGDDLAESLPDELGDAFEDIEVPDELTELVEAFGPVEFGVITVERDGEHFVSPVRTAFDLFAIGFRGLERDDLEDGGIVFELLTGGLDDEFEEFFDDLFSEFEAEFDFEDFEEIEDFEDFEDFEDDFPVEPSFPPREPTGAVGSGPNGELLAGDVVSGSFAVGGEATFVVLGTDGDAFIGAQSLNEGDLTIALVDVATGEELDFSDDFVGVDPEAFATLSEGQAVLVTVRAFGDDEAGDFVVYYEN